MIDFLYHVSCFSGGGGVLCHWAGGAVQGGGGGGELSPVCPAGVRDCGEGGVLQHGGEGLQGRLIVQSHRVLDAEKSLVVAYQTVS